MTAEMCLALYLSWKRSRGNESCLCLVFGITGSVCSTFLRFARRILLRVLAADNRAQIKMPNDIEIPQFQRLFESRHSELRDVYCVADGLKLLLQQSGDTVIQNRFYNGWKHEHYVSNVFVFAPTGKIIASAINAPGCLHDSVVDSYGNIYEKQ